MSWKQWMSVLVVVVMAGCQERTSLLPNQDLSLRRKDKEFMADAATRFPYKESAPKGTTNAMAEVDYQFHWVGIVNLTDQQWNACEVWINKQYVVYVPAWNKDVLKRLDFSMIKDERGNSFTTDGGRHPISSVELLIGGTMYPVTLHLAD